MEVVLKIHFSKERKENVCPVTTIDVRNAIKSLPLFLASESMMLGR
jgi:hypothetical protein